MLAFAEKQPQQKPAPNFTKSDTARGPAPEATRPKLVVSTPGNLHEQEADHIAGRVTRLPEPRLQRACACGGGCPRCQAKQPGREHPTWQTGHMGPSDSGQLAPPLVHEVLASAGQPLDSTTRSFMESRFGHDFSDVRIHSGADAEQSARELNANAYTVGRDIVFGAGRFAPETHEGRRLLGHELTHVVQGAPGVVQRDEERTGQAPAREPGAPYRLELANPLSDVEAHASLYELLPALVGRLSAEYNIDEKLAWRLVEWALGGLGFMTEMTYSHEQGGHGGEGRRLGWSPTASIDAPWSGETSRGVPAGVIPTAEQNLRFSFMGGNQQSINATRMESRWTLRGDISYEEAMAYLYAKTNLAAYAVRTFALSITADKDDVYNYVTNQGSLSVGELMGLAAVADLLSGAAWAALIGQWNYLRHGERRVRIPTFKVGREMRATIPNWQVLLSSRGPLLGGRSTINVGGRFPVEVSVDMSLDEPGIAVGAQLHAPVTPRLTLSPFGRFSYGKSEGRGGLLGLEARYNLAGIVGISATLSYREDDLLSQPEGAAEGWAGRAALTLEF